MFANAQIKEALTTPEMDELRARNEKRATELIKLMGTRHACHPVRAPQCKAKIKLPY